DEQDSQKLDDDSVPRRGKRGRDKVRTHLHSCKSVQPHDCRSVRVEYANKEAAKGLLEKQSSNKSKKPRSPKNKTTKKTKK
ncbi:MAG: hypothetical protein SGPRY_011574, partial [Prymnesium sp.]